MKHIIFILKHNIINEINIIHLKIQYKYNNETYNIYTET